MARNLITRTIKSTKVNALCLDIVSAEPFNQSFTLAGNYKDTAVIKKVLEKQFNNEEHVIAHIVSVEELNTLYGMSEQKFIENAEVLPARKQYNKEA